MTAQQFTRAIESEKIANYKCPLTPGQAIIADGQSAFFKSFRIEDGRPKIDTTVGTFDFDFFYLIETK
jgi:hypothetical protein